MVTKTLDINSLAAANPATPPTGYSQLSGSQNARIFQFELREWSMVPGGTQSVWRDDSPMSGDVITSRVVIGATNGTRTGPALVDGSGNGYVMLSSDGSNNATSFFKIVDGQLGSQIGETIAYPHATGQSRDIRRSGNTYTAWVNGVQIGGDYVDSSYDPTYAAMVSRGAYIRSLTSEYTPSRTVDSITDPIALGSAISVGLTGYTAPTSVTGGGMSATGLSFAAGTLTATWPALSESLAPTVALPATGVTITVTESDGSATITANINLPSGHIATAFLSAIDDPRYLGGNIALSDGWRAYYESNQAGVGDIEIQSDGRIIADNPGTFTMHLHKFGGDNSITQYSITINEAGEVVEVGGLTARDLTMTGLAMRGLTMIGL